MDPKTLAEPLLAGMVPSIESDMQTLESRTMSIVANSETSSTIVFKLEPIYGDFTTLTNISFESNLEVKSEVTVRMSDMQFRLLDQKRNGLDLGKAGTVCTDANSIAIQGSSQLNEDFPFLELDGHPVYGYYCLFDNVKLELKDSVVLENFYPPDFYAWVMLQRATLSPDEFTIFQERIGCKLAHPSTNLQGWSALQTNRVPYINRPQLTSLVVKSTQWTIVPTNTDVVNVASYAGLAAKPPTRSLGYVHVTMQLTHTINLSLPLPLSRKLTSSAFPMDPLGPLIVTWNFNPQPLYKNPTFYDVSLNPEGTASMIGQPGDTMADTNPPAGFSATAAPLDSSKTTSVTTGSTMGIDRYIVPRRRATVSTGMSYCVNTALFPITTPTPVPSRNPGNTTSSTIWVPTQAYTDDKFLPNVHSFLMYKYNALLLSNISHEYVYGTCLDTDVMRTVCWPSLKRAYDTTTTQDSVEKELTEYIQQKYTAPSISHGDNTILWRLTRLEPNRYGRPATDQLLFTSVSTTSNMGANGAVVFFNHLRRVGGRGNLAIAANLGYVRESALLIARGYQQTTDLFPFELESTVKFGLAPIMRERYTQNGREVCIFVTPNSPSNPSPVVNHDTVTQDNYIVVGFAYNFETSSHAPNFNLSFMAGLNPQLLNTSHVGIGMVDHPSLRSKRANILAMVAPPANAYNADTREAMNFTPVTLFYNQNGATNTPTINGFISIGACIHQGSHSGILNYARESVPFESVAGGNVDTNPYRKLPRYLVATGTQTNTCSYHNASALHQTYIGQTNPTHGVSNAFQGYALLPIEGGGYGFHQEKIPLNPTYQTTFYSLYDAVYTGTTNLPINNAYVTNGNVSLSNTFASSIMTTPDLDTKVDGILISPHTVQPDQHFHFLRSALLNMRMNFTLNRCDKNKARAMKEELESSEGLDLAYLDWDIQQFSVPKAYQATASVPMQFSTTVPVTQREGLGFTSILCTQGNGFNFPQRMQYVPQIDIRVNFNDTPLFTLAQGIPPFPMPLPTAEYVDMPTAFPPTKGTLKWMMPKQVPYDPIFHELCSGFLDLITSRTGITPQIKAWNTMFPQFTTSYLNGKIAMAQASLQLTILYNTQVETCVLHPRMSRYGFGDFGQVVAIVDGLSATRTIIPSYAWDRAYPALIQNLGTANMALKVGNWTGQGLSPGPYSTLTAPLGFWMTSPHIVDPATPWRVVPKPNDYIERTHTFEESDAHRVFAQELNPDVPPALGTLSYWAFNDSTTTVVTSEAHLTTSLPYNSTAARLAVFPNNTNTGVLLDTQQHNPTGQVAIAETENINILLILMLWRLAHQIVRKDPNSGIFTSVNFF